MSTILQWRTKAIVERTSMSEWLSYEAFDEKTNTYRLDDGRLGIIWASSPVLGLDEGRIQKLLNMFESDLPIGTTMQFMLHVSPIIEPLMTHHEVLSQQGSSDPQDHRDAKATTEFFLKARKTSLIPVPAIKPRDCTVYVAVTVPIKDFNSHGVDEESAHQTLAGIEEQLRGLGLFPERLPALQLIWLLYVLLNPSHTWEERPTSYFPEIPIRDQVVMRNTTAHIRHRVIELDGQFVKPMSVQAWPKVWHGGRNREFIGSLMKITDQITCPFFVTMSVVRLDQQVEKARIAKKHLINTQQAKPWMKSLIPVFGAKQDHFEMTVQLVEEGRQYVGMMFQVVLYGETAEQAQQQADGIKSLYRALDINLQDDECIGFAMFLSGLPMAIRSDLKYLRQDLRRLKTMISSVPANCCPIVGDWKGGGPPVMLFSSRMGQMVALDLFANPAGNYNASVIATTGGGKSFFVNNLIKCYLQTGGRVWMIDAGYSYVKLCEMLKGQYIQYGTQGSRLCFNPFTKLVHWGSNTAFDFSDMDEAERAKDRADEMAVLVSVLAQMVSPSLALDDVRQALLEQATMKVLQEEGNAGTVTAVMQVLLDTNDMRAHDLALVLEKFSKKGQYARLFNGKNNIDFENDFVVVEMDGLGDQKALGSVLLFCVQMNIQTSMYEKANKGRRKFLGMDEAWDLLSGGGNSAQFFEKGVRRVRKYGGSLFTITQSVDDYLVKMGATGLALLQNSDFKFLLRQLPESIERMRETGAIKLSDFEYTLLSTVNRGRGYSEIFSITPFGRGIMRLTVPRRMQLMYTTDPNELAALDRLRGAGASQKTYQEAIDILLEMEVVHQGA